MPLLTKFRTLLNSLYRRPHSFIRDLLNRTQPIAFDDIVVTSFTSPSDATLQPNRPAIPVSFEVRLTPEYPLTLYLCDKPRDRIRTGATLSIADPNNPTALFLGTVLGIRAFELFHVEYVLEYGGEGGRRRDNLLVPIEWASLTHEELQWKAAAVDPFSRYHTLPNEEQTIFIPGVQVWDAEAVATRTPHFF